MSVLDTYVANDCIYRVLENGNADATFPSLLTSMFTATEIIDSMNRVQQAFLLETGMIVTRTTITGQVGKPKYDLPVDSIRPRRVTWGEPVTTAVPKVYLRDSANVTWQISVTNAGLLTVTASPVVIAPVHIGLNDTAISQAWYLTILPSGLLQTSATAASVMLSQFSVNAPGGAIWQVSIANGLLQTSLVPASLNIHALTLVDTWELDNGASNWPSDRDIPIAWWETTLPQQQIGIAKTPINAGTIGLLYVALATTLTGAGIVLTVPDDWTPYILYGTLAELLSSDGPSFDPVRANYCTTRLQEGIELARLVLGGTD